MKKFFKMFGVFTLTCCCMLGFVGCKFFEEEKIEYEELIAERKIVRDVVENVKTIFKPTLEDQENPVTFTSVVNTNNEDEIAHRKQQVYAFIGIIETVINADDFVPGKLYNAEVIDEMSEGTHYYYYLINAYCGEDEVVTLNCAMVRNSKDNKTFAINSNSTSIDLYYNEEYKPTRVVQYMSSYHTQAGDDDENILTEGCLIRDFEFSVTGEFESFVCFERDVEEINGVVENTIRRQESIDKNGELTEVEEYDVDEEVFTEEMRETLDANMDLAKERTYLYEFGRPLSQKTYDKIFGSV